MKWASVHGRCSLQSLLIVAPILLSLDNRQYVTKSALFFGSVPYAVWFVQSICTFGCIVHFHCILGFELWRPEQWGGKQGGTSRCLWGGNYPLLNCALWIIHCLPNLTLSPSRPPKSSSIMCLSANLLTYRLIRKKNPKTVENLLANSSLLSPLISRATTFLKLCNGLMSRKNESLRSRETSWHPYFF